MNVTAISTSLQTASGPPVEGLLKVALAAAFPLRMVRHFASPSPPSRPMAAALVPYQSRVGDETTRAGDDLLLLSDPAGSLRRTA